MSHQSEWLPKAGKLLEKIETEINAIDGVMNAEASADHKDMMFSLFAALQRAIGPIFETFTAEGDGYTATFTKPQASFLHRFMTDSLSVISAGLKTRVNDQELSRQADEALDSIVSLYGEEDYPTPVKDMVAMGQIPEIQAIVSISLENAAASEGKIIFDQISEAAIKRSAATFETNRVMSLIHDIVVVNIGSNRKLSETAEKAPVEKTRICENVIQVNFGGSRAIAPAPACLLPQENIAK